ncbi:MAG: hypothetical protein J4O01_05950 [Chloroflexi bacterium]|nr:hypothetical protein [Chloroflexota bacterium]MCI0774414.1 hypothetical protein [Chloroflexota bacterium]MCI0833223.1 hypothetical protein [Chloroflexota bacterium]MCI0835669.1 hypothetical protein [Chloroflexota bacterium]MCI0851582.1 hypothetical protein [Chloroflexota bacterium]
MTPAEAPDWHRASLIPTTGIGGAKEQEMRATSALLSVLSAVPEFSKSLLRQFGAPAGTVETFVEVPFEAPDGRMVRPDGLIRVSRGKRSWVCLVEVKTGRNMLDREQLETYLDVARTNGFDALVTISNQYSPSAGVHPVKVSGHKLRRVQMHHLSWIALITEATIQHEHRGISDPDQAWILEELIRYLEHPNSGALQFEDMGQHWVSVRNSAKDGTLRKTDPGVEEVVERWIEFMRFLSLQLGRELGAEVRQSLSKNERNDQSFRVNSAMQYLESEQSLRGAFSIPDAIAVVGVSANLARRVVEANITVDAPKEGRPRTRVNWVVRQLSKAPDNTRIVVSFDRRRDTTSNTLSALRDEPSKGLLVDNQVNPRRFTIALTADMGVKKGNGQGSFVDSVQTTLEDFYREIVQVLKAWQPPAPKLPASEAE